jgi:hypothetical protein
MENNKEIIRLICMSFLQMVPRIRLTTENIHREIRRSSIEEKNAFSGEYSESLINSFVDCYVDIISKMGATPHKPFIHSQTPVKNTLTDALFIAITNQDRFKFLRVIKNEYQEFMEGAKTCYPITEAVNNYNSAVERVLAETFYYDRVVLNNVSSKFISNVSKYGLHGRNELIVELAKIINSVALDAEPVK